MTLEELLELSAIDYKKMTDEELSKHFAPYYNVTRPELAPKPVRVESKFIPVDPKLKQNAEKLAALGIDVSHLLKRKKKF